MDVYNLLNQILSTICAILIIVISSISTPEISEYVKDFLSSNIHKLFLIAIVVYLAFNNFVLGVILTMGLYLIIEGDNLVVQLQEIQDSTNEEEVTTNNETTLDDDKIAASVVEAEVQNLEKVPKEIVDTNNMDTPIDSREKNMTLRRTPIGTINKEEETTTNRVVEKVPKKSVKVSKKQKSAPVKSNESKRVTESEINVPIPNDAPIYSIVPNSNVEVKSEQINSPIETQIDMVKEVSPIESVSTRSQRGLAEFLDSVVEVNSEVDNKKCNASSPKDCSCKEIKQGGNDYNIDTLNDIMPYDGNKLYNF